MPDPGRSLTAGVELLKLECARMRHAAEVAGTEGVGASPYDSAEVTAGEWSSPTAGAVPVVADDFLAGLDPNPLLADGSLDPQVRELLGLLPDFTPDPAD